jgi:hypothetical protein
MDEVDGCLAAFEGGVEAGRLEDVTGDDFDAVPPGARLETLGVAGQATHLVPPFEEHRHETSPDVPGCAGDEDSHGSERRATAVTSCRLQGKPRAADVED